jgi:hypothetical protein
MYSISYECGTYRLLGETEDQLIIALLNTNARQQWKKY